MAKDTSVVPRAEFEQLVELARQSTEVAFTSRKMTRQPRGSGSLPNKEALFLGSPKNRTSTPSMICGCVTDEVVSPESGMVA